MQGVILILISLRYCTLSSLQKILHPRVARGVTLRINCFSINLMIMMMSIFIDHARSIRRNISLFDFTFDDH